MIDITVKTLDGKNRSYSVPDDITVRQFKEHITASIEISVELQRLIYRGQVLADDKKINDYDVNGKTIHVVQRAPPPLPSRPGGATDGATAGGSRQFEERGMGGMGRNEGFMLVPPDPNHIQNIVQQVLSGMGEFGQGTQVTTHSSADGSSMDVHINMTGQQSGAAVQSESQNRIDIALQMISSARRTLDRLENGDLDETPMDDDATPDSSQSQSSAGAPSSGSSTGESQNVSSSRASRPADETTSGGTEPRHPSVSVLVSLMSDVLSLNDRLRPHFLQSQQILDSDSDYSSNEEERQRAQRTYDMTSEVMHYMSHVYHNLSDLMIDMSQAPPRVLRAAPVPLQPTAAAIMQQTIPVQINVAHIPLQGQTMSQGVQAQAQSQGAQTQTTAAQSTAAQAGAAQAQTAWAQFGGTGVRGQAPSMASQGSQTTGTQASVRPSTVSAGTNTTGGNAAQVRFGGTFGPGVGMWSSGVRSSRMHMEAGMPPPGMMPIPPMPGAAGGMGFPPGFHMIVEMGSNQQTGSDNAADGSVGEPTTGGTGSDGTGVQPQGDATQAQQQASMGGGFGGPPPDFLQNIIQMATDAAMRAQQGGQVFVMTNDGNIQSVRSNPSSTDNPTTSSAGSTTAAGSSTSSSSAGPSAASRGPSTASGSAPGTPGRTGASAAGGNRSNPRMTMFAPMRGPGGPVGGFNMQAPPGFAMPPGIFIPPIDPHLFCHSRHFTARRVAMAAQATGTNLGHSQAAASAAGTGTAGTGTAADIPSMVSNIVSSIVSSAAAAASAASTAGGAVNPPTASSSSSVSAQQLPNPVQAPPMPGGAANPFQVLFGRMPAMGRVSGSGAAMPLAAQISGMMRQVNGSGIMTGGGPGMEGNPIGSGVGAPPVDDMFARMLQGISAQLFGQQPGAGSISQFLATLGQDYTITPGEGLLTDLFNCVAQNLAFTDLMMIFIGQSAPLERLREPLQSFMRDSVLRDQEPTQDGITTTVDRLIENMRADIQTAAASTPAREGIDLEATIMTFIRTTLQEIMQLVISATPESGFAQRLYDRLRQMVHECVALSRVSLQGGVSALDTILQNRIHVIASDVNPAMQSWMTQMSLSQLHQIVPSVTLTDDAVARYVVRQSEACTTDSVPRVKVEASPQSSESHESFASVGSNPDEIEMRSDEGSASDSILSSAVTSDSTTSASIPIETLSCNDESLPTRPRISPAQLARVPPPVKRDGESDVEVIVGSEDWHAAVPPEWVPVITQDVVRQRRQAVDTSLLSDAYIAGMPSKRRKIMTRDKRQNDQFGDARAHVPQTVRHAAQVAGVEPTTSFDALSRDVTDDLDLCEAFRGEVGVAIRRRIREDPGYSPDKYPATEEYFNQK